MPDLFIMQTVLLLIAIAVVTFLYSSAGHGGATGYVAVAALLGLGSRVLVWQLVVGVAVVVSAACVLLGTYLGVNRWRTTTFRRALTSVLWIAAGKLILTGK